MQVESEHELALARCVCGSSKGRFFANPKVFHA